MLKMLNVKFKVLYRCADGPKITQTWKKLKRNVKIKSTIFDVRPNTSSVQESERKAYNPRPFCKTYTMDKQPLNTGEQKDMTEFFTDLITKIEEMSQELVIAHESDQKRRLAKTQKHIVHFFYFTHSLCRSFGHIFILQLGKYSELICKRS